LVGLVASCLAYGRVKQILRSVDEAVQVMGTSPFAFVMRHMPREIKRAYRGFRHRFSDGEQLGRMLAGAKAAIRQYGSLEACFVRGWSPADGDVMDGLCDFVREVGAGQCGSLLPLPERGSACKRLNLFLRWMVRHDEVDPGGWAQIPPSALVIPLDVHMHRFGLSRGMTARKQPDMRAAREVTEVFRTVSPEDPARYDFALTRAGIMGGARLEGRL
jgi:uncharacterized protein (TIGR02757 family)